MFLSIITPTYNRAYTLPVLYKSLCMQTDKDFEWIVVDDGSTDNTRDIIQSWIDEKILDIHYYYKTNGGEQSASNLGISKSSGLFMLKVDSDDRLIENALERIKFYSQSDMWNKNKDKLCGIVFLDLDPNGNVIGNRFDKDLFIGNHIKDRINKNIVGDKAEVCLTNLVKQVPDAIFPGEKYGGCGSRWIRLAKKYDMIFVNEGIYIADYQEDGYTKKGIKTTDYPLTFEYYANLHLTKEFKHKIRIKQAILYISLGLYVKKRWSDIISSSNAPILVCILFIPGYMSYLKKQLKDNRD